jgi:hypothetical protein
MEAGVGDLTLADVPSLLSLCDDELVFVVRAAHAVKTLTALASTCSRLCALARSRVPVKLRLQDAPSARLLLRLASSGRPQFSSCEALEAVAKDAGACCQVPGVLVVAAGLANLRALDLTVSPPPSVAAAAAVDDDDTGLELFDEISCGVAGLLAPMQWRQHGFQQLQQLKLEVPALGACGATFVGGLKQLTSLQLKQGRGWQVNIAPPDLSFLEGMVKLVELEVHSTSEPMSLAAAAGPFRLPRSLQRLQLANSSHVQTAEWLEHLPECPQLTQLHLTADTDEDEVPFHPAAMLELAASHTPGLRRLVWRAVPSQFTAPAPLDQNTLWEQPLPLEAVSALTALQHLDPGGFLAIHSAVDWEALGSLTSVTSLDGFVVYQAPPQQWQNMHVKQLGAALEDVSGREAVQLLQAFPAAQSIRLQARSSGRIPGDTEGAGSGEQGVPRALTNLTSLQLDYDFSQWQGDPPAVHAAPLLAVATGVVELSLRSCGWAWEGSCQLPDLSGCTAVTRLLADAYNEQVLAKDVVAMVQPLAPTLRVLELQWMECIPPQAATALQDVLPHLEHVHFNRCRKMSADPAAGTEEEQLARLRQQLRPGLRLTVLP